MNTREFNIGDKVICFEEGFVIGTVLRFYTPTSCPEQTVVKTNDGRQYHAPTRAWKPYSDGVSPSHIICDELSFSHKDLNRNVIAIHNINKQLTGLEANTIIKKMVGWNTLSFDFNVIDKSK